MFITLDKRATLSLIVISKGLGLGGTRFIMQQVMAWVLTFSREVVAAGDLGFSRGAAVQRVTLVVKTWTSCPMYAAINCKERRNITTLTAKLNNVEPHSVNIKQWLKDH